MLTPTSGTDILSGGVAVTDLAGASASVAEELLLSLRSRHAVDTAVYLVTPEFAMHSLTAGVARCFNIENRVYPHLDLDHIPESAEMGWPVGLSLGVHKANLGCIVAHAEP